MQQPDSLGGMPPPPGGLPPNVTPENMQQTLEMLQATLNRMPEEERVKLFDKMSEEERKILLPGGKASMGADGLKTEDQGIKITPEPGFTIKTKDTTANNKIFINVCTHEGLDAPGMKKKLNDAGETVEGYNVPMSIGPARPCKDKSGVESTVYDMIVNPEVITEINEDITGKQRDFICQLALQCVGSKYKLQLDQKYKLPFKLDYIGDVAHQWIKDKKSAPKIEEVAPTGKGAGSSSSAATAAAAKGAKAGSGKQSGAGAAASAPMVVENLKELPVEFTWTRTDRTAAAAPPSSSSNSSDESAGSNRIEPSNLEPSLTYVECHRLAPAGVAAYVLTIDPIAAIFLRAGGGAENAIDIDENVKIQASPFKIQLKINGYKPVTYYLPCAIHPALIASKLGRSSEGYTNKLLKLTVTLPVDHRFDVTVPPTAAAMAGISSALNNAKFPTFYQAWDALVNGDPGSRPWLVANALSAESSGAEHNPYLADVQSDEDDDEGDVEGGDSDSGKGKGKGKRGKKKTPSSAPLPFSAINTLFEKVNDHFVVYSNSSGGSSRSTAGKSSKELLQEAEDEVLPEDRFHSKDAGSQYIISQREQSVVDKREKFEKEKQERQKDEDPNVEYVDTDDYKPGGKYGAKLKNPDEAMNRAASTIASSAAVGDNAAGTDAAAADMSSSGEPSGLAGLTSTLWSELL